MFTSLKYIKVYVFCRYEHIRIPTFTQHLLTRSVRSPDGDRLKVRGT